MRLSIPRIEPLTDNELSAADIELLDPLPAGGRMNIFRTLVRRPEALKRFVVWGDYVLYQNSLGAREREIVILRIGFLCRSGYEWAQHAPLGLRRGLTSEELERIKIGAGAPGWGPADAALLQAADELHTDQFITDTAWSALCQHFDESQCIDVVLTAAQYTQVSMLLNTFGVQLDAGQTLDPDLQAF